MRAAAMFDHANIWGVDFTGCDRGETGINLPSGEVTINCAGTGLSRLYRATDVISILIAIDSSRIKRTFL